MECPKHLQEAFSKTYTHVTTPKYSSVRLYDDGSLTLSTPTPNGDGVYVATKDGCVYQVDRDLTPILLAHVPNIEGKLVNFTIHNGRLFYVGYDDVELHEVSIGDDGEVVSDTSVAKIEAVGNSGKQRELSTEVSAKMFSVGDNKIVIPTHGAIRVYDGKKLNTYKLPVPEDSSPLMKIYVSDVKPVGGNDGNKLVLCGDYFIPYIDTRSETEKVYSAGGGQEKTFVMTLDLSTGKFEELDDVIKSGEVTSFDTDGSGNLVFGVSRYNAPGKIIRYNPKTGDRVIVYDDVIARDGYNWVGSVTCLPNGSIIFTDEVDKVYCILPNDDVITWDILNVTDIAAVGDNSVFIDSNTGKIARLDLDK